MLNLHKILMLLLLFMPMLACDNGIEATANESWTLVEITTKGEKTNSRTQEVEVRNCVVPEHKSHSCSAGTSRDFSASLGGGGGVGISLSADVSTDFGFSADSGQELSLDTPEKGYTYQYTLRETYRVVAGTGKARSSSGKTQEASYNFHASCQLQIESVETVSCGSSREEVEVTPTAKAAVQVEVTPTAKPETHTEDNSNSLTARDYYNKGKACNSQDYDCQIENYSQAIRLDPNYAVAYHKRGFAYDDKGEYDRAIADYNETIRLDPNASAYYNRGIAYSNKGDYDRSIADYNEAIHLDPNHTFAYVGRGVAYANKGNKEQAIADYKKALELPDRNNAHQWAREKLARLGVQ